MSINTYSLLTTFVRDARAKAYHDSLRGQMTGRLYCRTDQRFRPWDRAPLLASAPAVQTEEPASPEEAKKREIMAELARRAKPRNGRGGQKARAWTAK